jgi:hypothetical protein
MVGHYAPTANGELFYYRCNRAHKEGECNNRRSISESNIESHFLEIIQPELKRVIAEYEVIEKTPIKRPKVDIVGKLEKKLQRVNYQYEEDRITQEEYDRKYKALVEEIAKARAEQNEPEITKRDLEPLKAFLKYDLNEIYKTLTREEKLTLWRSVVSEIVLHPDGRIEPKFF